MRFSFKNFVCLAIASLFAALPCCAGPPVASRLKIGEDYADLPKSDSFTSAKYEYTNATTGEHRTLEIKNAQADPAANLKAFADTQAANLHVLEAAVNKIAIPGVTTTAPVVAPPVTTSPATPATAPPPK